MKYLKTFESEDLTYQVGDYVMINTKKIERKIDAEYDNAYDAYKQIRVYKYAINGDYKNNIVKITEISISKYGNHRKDYDVEFPNGRTWSVSEDEIKRKLTPKEIEKYETQKNVTKYNL